MVVFLYAFLFLPPPPPLLLHLYRFRVLVLSRFTPGDYWYFGPTPANYSAVALPRYRYYWQIEHELRFCVRREAFQLMLCACFVGYRARSGAAFLLQM